jgi:hypothetical protein
MHAATLKYFENAKFIWLDLLDWLPEHTRHGCEATNFRWALSRRRFGSAMTSSLLSTLPEGKAAQASRPAPSHRLWLRLPCHTEQRSHGALVTSSIPMPPE